MIQLDSWIEIQTRTKEYNENSDGGAKKEIKDSFMRSLTGVTQNDIPHLKSLWKNSSWRNFSRFRWNYHNRYELDARDFRIKELLTLSEKNRAFKVFNAAMFTSKNSGAQSYDGCHLIFWIAQQRKVDELQVYSQYTLIKEALHYLSSNKLFAESSHLAGVNNFHQEASIQARKVAISVENLEKKADWFARSAGYAARAECLLEAQRLIDQAVETHIQAGDYLNAGFMMYEFRERRLIENLDNDFITRYRATPEFVDKLPLPERHSLKYPSETFVNLEMLKRAIILFNEGAKNPPTKLPLFYNQEEYIERCKKQAKYWEKRLKEKRKV